MTEPSDAARSIVSVLDDLKSTPVLLALVLLNGFFIVGAAYYLIHSEEFRANERLVLIKSLDNCVQNTVPTDFLKKRE